MKNSLIVHRSSFIVKKIASILAITYYNLLPFAFRPLPKIVYRSSLIVKKIASNLAMACYNLLPFAFRPFPKIAYRSSLIVIIMFLFASCSSKKDDEANKTVFRYNESAGISSLDPAFAKDMAIISATTQIYNGLVQINDQLEVEPCIAKQWSISPDGKEYTFILRNDVQFHRHSLFKDNTRKVVASDFVFSLERILDSSVASPGSWVFNEVDFENGKPAFFAPNDTTFIIRLKSPFAPFLSLLTMPYCSVVPKEIVAHYGKDFRRQAIGTGPFYLKTWKEGVKMVLLKNPDYFEYDEINVRLPYLDAVAINFIVDKQTAFLEFVKGNLDFMNSLDASYKDELLTKTGQLRPKYAGRIKMQTQPYLNTEYLGFRIDAGDSPAENPLLKKEVRQAINYAFDRKKMIVYLRNNIGTPGTSGIIPKNLLGHDTTHQIGYHYNPEKTRALLAKAGYPNGKGLPDIKLSTTASYLDLCKYIQQQLNLLNIPVKIDVNPPGALRELIAQGKSPWFRASWVADYPDAENYLSLFYSKNFAPKGPNYTHFKNVEYDKLYELAKGETQLEKRIGYYQKMDKIMMEEAPVVILYYDQVLRFSQPNIHGLESNPMNLLFLKRVQKL